MVLKSILETCVVDQRNQLIQTDLGIVRDSLQEIKLRKEFITIITGIRRSGKSTLMHQLIHQLEDDFAYFHFEDPRIFGFSVDDFPKLEEILGEKIVYFFDEIQNVPQWELFVRKLHDKGKVICITGSNASLLSKELGTRLTGRNITKELFPFNYSEYCTFYSIDQDSDSVSKYMNDGGIPLFLKTREITYLHQLLRDILYRDIIARHGIRNGKLVEELTLYLISNIAKPYSLNGLKKIFNLGSANSVSDYLSWLEDSYLFFTLPRFSWSLKSVAVNQKKIYSIDTGFAQANSLSFSSDKGRLFENMIYLSLRRKFTELYYFREKGECDFVVKEKEKVTQVVQACFDLNSDNLQREMNGLKEAMDFFGLQEGTIVTLKQTDSFKDDNKHIRVISANDWLKLNP
ncbi:MAG: ATP-binding protein [Crocinitomicaceae bacterium]|nr:ATP-binding protein [Crocinitomicaceae bacterium]MCF8409911.1 ATP-binding protein [Crocinitomicaceae bacterium]